MLRAREVFIKKMRQIFFICTAQQPDETYWQPSVDIYRVRNDWVVKVDLAGVRPEDIHVSAGGSTIIIEGIRRDSCEAACDFHSIEIPYSRFKRTISFPVDLGHARIRTKYEYGMLLVRISPEVEHE